jgi:AcrR family transcriptional regulator
VAPRACICGRCEDHSVERSVLSAIATSIDIDALPTRDALMRAGRRAFAERGYAGSRLADISGHAGLTTGAFYRHFPSKIDFFRSLFDDYGSDLRDALTRGRTLRAQLVGWMEVAREHRGVIRAVQELARAGTQEAETRRLLRKDVAALLAMRLGEQVELADLHEASLLISDVVNQYVLMEAAGWIPERDLTAVAAQVERLALKGLYRQ